MDYGRRNKIAFRIQVEKGNSETGTPRFKAIGDERYCSGYCSANHMNNSLMSLYRRGNPDSAGSSPRREQPKAGISASTPSGQTQTPGGATGGATGCATGGATGGATQVTSGGWFIDKGKTPERPNILIDLCEEDEASRIDQTTDVSMLEPEKTPKKGRLPKRSKKQKMENGKSKKDDKDIEASIMSKKVPNRSKLPELQYPTLKFEDVGGNENTLTEVCKLLIHMRHPEVYQQLGVVPPRGFLLHGPPGCGKTLLAQAVAGEMELPMLKVSAPELVSGVSGESEQKLRELFEQAVTSAPCILFIDEIDAITPKREVASKDMERRIVAQLLTCMDDLNSLEVTVQVLVIGATNRPDSLDPALRRAGRFDREICLGIPDEAARLRILKTLCRKLKLPEDFDYKLLARLTPGYVGADLMALCREAAMSAVNRVLLDLHDQATRDESIQLDVVIPASEPGELWRLQQLLRSAEPLSPDQLAGLSILLSDFQVSLASVQPSSKREGFATVPDVTWEDVGALLDIREELTMAILAPVRSPEQFRALGLSAPAGVLLAGPPGCGKTLLAKAVANESGLNFISVKGPELLNMYVGESERAVRQVFQRGCNSAPCVIFFDEIDALCPRRSGHESGASVRVVNQLLTEMDGLETRKQVFIMAATNRPDIIDPAVLRPGRLDKTLYVGLPPPADRHAILLTITKGGTRPTLEKDVNLEEIAHDIRCDCFTGADLSALVREASVNALRAYLTSHHTFSSGPVADIKVTSQNFEDAFKKVRPSVSKKVSLILIKTLHPKYILVFINENLLG
uniref:AAA+ ATPase domain-containing protein n=1 Tax=Gadus morhua TaxID=8049 RepID=A0A8C5BEM1_GADMO